MVKAPVSLILGLLVNALSRRHEYGADDFAAIATGRPQDQISGLKKLSAANMANLTPHPLYVLLHASHPPVLARIRALAADHPQAQQAATPPAKQQGECAHCRRLFPAELFSQSGEQTGLSRLPGGN